MDTTNHLTIRFEGNAIAPEDRGMFLLALERWARGETGERIEVFMERMQDDSKLRNAFGERRRRDMSDEERDQL